MWLRGLLLPAAGNGGQDGAAPTPGCGSRCVPWVRRARGSARALRMPSAARAGTAFDSRLPGGLLPVSALLFPAPDPSERCPNHKQGPRASPQVRDEEAGQCGCRETRGRDLGTWNLARPTNTALKIDPSAGRGLPVRSLCGATLGGHGACKRAACPWRRWHPVCLGKGRPWGGPVRPWSSRADTCLLSEHMEV